MKFVFQCCTKSSAVKSIYSSTGKDGCEENKKEDTDDVVIDSRGVPPLDLSEDESSLKYKKLPLSKSISFKDELPSLKEEQPQISKDNRPLYVSRLSSSSLGPTDVLDRPSTAASQSSQIEMYTKKLALGASAHSLFSEESATESKDRRQLYRMQEHNFRASVANGEEKTLQEQILDWCSKFVLLHDLSMVQNYRSSTASFQQNIQEIQTHMKFILWVRSLVALDPRVQIHNYFTEVARRGGPLADPLADAPLHIIQGFRKTSSFSIWRPTSLEAISLMMKGDATGKGMDIKGKSAKRGRLSGLVPFIQIHDEEHRHKGKLGLSKDGRVIVYFKSKKLRDDAIQKFQNVANDMKNIGPANLRWNVTDWKVYERNDCGFGLDVGERVLYEACVFRQDFTRQGDLETGRPSEPNFHVMNFESMRHYKGDGPRPVVYQTDEEDSLKPQTLVVAYEENKTVVPVASDFDCFTIGTRGVVYDEPMSNEVVDLMKWMIESIEDILANKNGKEITWTSCWFEALTKPDKRSKVNLPRFGFSDPKTYKIMEGAVTRFAFNRNGAVRHGAECFNFKFPQGIDDKLLVVADRGEMDHGSSSYLFHYLSPPEVQDFMMEKLDEGFVFPLNPKWILADIGWKKVYDKMLLSGDPEIQQSLNVWYPKESGVRELIERVHEKYPHGFTSASSPMKVDDTEELDLLQQKLKRKELLEGAMEKIRALRSMGLFKERLRSSMINNEI